MLFTTMKKLQLPSMASLANPGSESDRVSQVDAAYFETRNIIASFTDTSSVSSIIAKFKRGGDKWLKLTIYAFKISVSQRKRFVVSLGLLSSTSAGSKP